MLRKVSSLDKTSGKKKLAETYKTANYYARTVVFGLLIWFAIILVLYISGYSTVLDGVLGSSGQIVFLLLTLLLSLAIGYFVNRLTWNYMVVNKL